MRSMTPKKKFVVRYEDPGRSLDTSNFYHSLPMLTPLLSVQGSGRQRLRLEVSWPCPGRFTADEIFLDNNYVKFLRIQRSNHNIKKLLDFFWHIRRNCRLRYRIFLSNLPSTKIIKFKYENIFFQKA